jgi:SAM-dependent methyltransferase
MPVPYTTEYFRWMQQGSRRSAREVVPLVLELLRPRSIVDVGCGTGSWLAVFREHGIEDVLGIDGDYVDRRILEIPGEQVIAFDLKNALRLERRFDLAVSLEVAQNLPHECAETFVASLVDLAPAVLFSASIPHQGGLVHINQRWPAYWAAHFQARGYVAFDCLRPKVWQNDAVEWWYAQNMFLFIERRHVKNHPLLHAGLDGTLPLVHPKNYVRFAGAAMPDPRTMSLRWVLPALPHMAARAVARRMKRLFQRG